MKCHEKNNLVYKNNYEYTRAHCEIQKLKIFSLRISYIYMIKYPLPLLPAVPKSLHKEKSENPNRGGK